MSQGLGIGVSLADKCFVILGDLTMKRRLVVATFILSLAVALFVVPSGAQAQVILSSSASPAAGSPGLTTVNVTGSNFPAGTINPASVTVTLAPSAGGTLTTATPSAVTTILGTTRRITFVIPASISVSTATPFKVTVAGSATSGTTFSSSNYASLTINPAIPAVQLSNPSLTFANQVIGTTSAAQTITVNNNGTTSLSISSISLTGTNPAEYKEVNVNCPISPSTLAAGGSCTVQVSFQPLAVGTRTASVTFIDNSGGAPGTQQNVGLSGTASAATPTVTTIPVTFNPGTNVSGVATLNCPSNTVPCTDPNAHSLKVVVSQVNTAFTLSVTTFEVSLAEANGVCEAGKDETNDFDCRFKTSFSYQTQTNGDVIVPQCIPVSNGNCVYYRIGNVPAGSAYQGPVFETISWNNNAFVPSSFYQTNNPRLFDDPDSAPYDTNHQFVFDITDFFNSNGNHVGVDPTISGHTKQYNDFVVAFPSTLPNPAYTFTFVSPLPNGSSSFQQGTNASVSFSLTQGTTPVPNAVTSPNAAAIGLNNANGVRQATLAPDGTAAAFTYNPTAQQYVLTLATQNLVPGTYTIFVNSNLFLQQSTTFTITPAPLQIISTSPLPAGSTAGPYSQTLTATGGTGPYTWAITGGTQPAGLTLSSAGVLSGTPGAAVASSFTVTATDAASQTVSKLFTLSITTTTGTPTSMTANAGTTPQSARINTAFANALAVTVRDTSNNPVSGVNVTFTAPGSGASGLFSNSTATITVATNASGIAAAPFTANAAAGGPYTVTAAATGLSTVNFSLTNTSGTASTMTANAGTTPQSARVATAFVNALAVTVKDASNNPVPAVNVTFTAPASGASGVFSNSTVTITVATNALGVASAPFTANATAGGPYTVTAAATGLSTVNFALTNTPGTASTMSANAGTTPQLATVSTAFANALAVTVKDSSNNPVSGVNVIFTAPGSGAAGLFSNSTTTITVATNASGIAAAPFTANATAGGPYTVSAASTGLTTVNFSLTNSSGAPGTMTANAGTTPQSSTISTAFANVLAVTVRDASNNPVPAVNVTFTAPASGASGLFSNSTTTITVTTNAVGVASAPFTANSSAGGPYSVTASATGVAAGVSFSLTNTPGLASSMSANAGTTPQSAKVATAFANALAVTVRDSSNNPVPAVNVTFTAPASGASGLFSNSTATITVATNASGIAAAPFTANATAGGPYTVTAAATGLSTVNFSLTNTPGTASTMTANAGTTPQSATVSTTFANALAVTVKDAGNNPVSGVNVIFTAPGSGASGLFSNSTVTITVATNASGVASAPFTANATAGGPYTVAAAATGLTTVNFSLTNTAAAASTMTANAGTTPQSATVSTAFANALAVTVKDAGNNPVPGVNVTFTAPGSGASGLFTNSTVTITVATNASGVASAPFTANATAGGPYTVTATATGLTGVNFSLTNAVGVPSTMTANAGTTPQSAIVSATFANSLAVTVKDAANNPVPGVNVTFTAPGSGASGLFISNSATTIIVATGATGIAVAPFKANATVGGPYTVTAAAAGLTTVNFSLTNTATTLGITSTSLPNGQVGLAYSTTLTATGGVPSYTWSISVGALPSGLTLNASTGVISGTPLGSGTVSFTIKVTDSATNTQTANVSIKVLPSQLTVTTTSLPNGQIGVAYSAALAAAGGTTPYTWAITSGALPANVTLNASTGLLSGTPTASGSFTVTFTVTDTSVPVQTQSASFTFTITTGPTLAGASPSTVNQGDSNVNVGITGQFTNFLPGVSTVSFGTADITVNSVTVTTATSLNVNISVAANAIIGARTVTVTTNAELATGTGLFAIHAGVPTVTVTPTFGVEGTNPTITITGTFTHFTQGLTTANFGSGDITAGAVTVNSPTQATVQIQISIAATVGSRLISIVTGSETASGSFNVTAGVPAIVVVSPNIGGQSATVTVHLTGNFTTWVNGTSVASFGPGIKVGGGTAGAFGPVTVTNGTNLTATLTIDPSATLGPRDVTVKTGTEQEIAAGAFTVANCTTTAASILRFEPAFGATGVPLNLHTRFEFNAPLDRTTLSSANTYLYEGISGNTIPSTFTVDVTGRMVTLIPSQVLGVGRQYYAYLGYGTGGAKDACANTINQYTTFTTSFSTETLGPSVLETSPLNGDTSVPENPQIVLEFSAPVDPISVESGLQVTTGTTPVPGTTTYSPDYTILTFTPGTNLAASTSYTVTYSNQILDQAGNALINPGSFSFTTGTATDVNHGSVTATNPQYSEVGVGTNIAPSFYLSKIVDPITVTTANVFLTNANTGKLMAGTVSVSSDRRHVTFTPSQALQSGTYYYIYFDAGSNALDLAGNYITSTYVYFTTTGSSITTGPTVTAVSPANLVTGTPVNTKVSITMSGLIDPNSVGNSAVTVTPQGSTTPVVGTVGLAADQVTVTWTPGANLATSTLYNVQVAGFRDTQGNLVTPFSSSFTTGSSSSPFTAGSLTLVSATPTNGATGVSNTSPVVLTFSHGVNPATLGNISVYVSTTGNQIAGTWTSSAASPAVATFTPAGMYPANSVINVYTTNRVQDFAGITDIVGIATTFTVAGTVDTIHPTVTSVTPTNGSTGIGRNTPVVLTFSESVDPTTINGNTVQLFVGDVAASFNPVLSANNRTVTLASTLPVNSTITVVATPFIKDLSGNTLTPFQSAFTTSTDFSTTAPGVVTQRPGSGATDVPSTL